MVGLLTVQSPPLRTAAYRCRLLAGRCSVLGVRADRGWGVGLVGIGVEGSFANFLYESGNNLRYCIIPALNRLTPGGFEVSHSATEFWSGFSFGDAGCDVPDKTTAVAGRVDLGGTRQWNSRSIS